MSDPFDKPPRPPASDPEIKERVKEKILLVDDDAVNIMFAEAVLRQAGYEVVTAESGQEALDILASNPGIDAVLTDIVMPGKTGIDLLQHIRENPQTANLPVVVMSSTWDKDDRDKKVRELEGKRLDKPLDPKKLESAIKQILDSTKI